MMDYPNSLPIKIIRGQKDDLKVPQSGGSTPKVFGDVTNAVRKSLTDQLVRIEGFYSDTFERTPGLPAVARVKLKPEALAKSHRPTALLNENTCPIIGGNSAGELYMSVNQASLGRLKNRIQSQSQKVTANVSTIDQILPFTPEMALSDEEYEHLRKQTSGNTIDSLKYRLFNHGIRDIDSRVYREFLRLARELNIEDLQQIHYTDQLTILRLRNVPIDALPSLASFVGTQSVSVFPQYFALTTTCRVVGSLTSQHLPPPSPAKSYGIVGVIDTGTDPNNQMLQAWVHARDERVPVDFQDNSHGSFVAGLIAGGKNLNHGDPRLPSSQCKILDVVALGRDGTTEDDLLLILTDVVRRYREVRVWNLSLGSSGTRCQDQQFSDFGAALDEMSQKYDVQFVVAAGNYTNAPLRSWPGCNSYLWHAGINYVCIG